MLLPLHLGSTVLLYSIIKHISCAAKLNRSRFCFSGSKMVKFCANIVRNGKMLLVSIFVDALTQRFTPLYFIALQSILPLLLSSRYKVCYLGGK